MAKNALEAAIAAHRRQLLQLDREALARILAYYTGIGDRLRPAIELLTQQIEREEALTPAQLFRLQRYQELQAQIEREMQRLAAMVQAATADGQDQATRLAIQHAQDAARFAAISRAGQAVVTGNWVRVPTRAIEDFLGAARSGPLADLLAGFSDVTATTMVKEITNAMATGVSPRVVADAITRTTDIARNRALTITRTEMLRAYRGASLESFRANEDIIDGWTWAAAQDAGTCAACLGMDGTLHDLDEEMDSHPNCRCTQIPHLKDEPMHNYTDGSTWLAGQSPDTQDRVLGLAGGEAYRSGEVTLPDFVRTSDSPQWGQTINDGGVAWARLNAQRRERRAA